MNFNKQLVTSISVVAALALSTPFVYASGNHAHSHAKPHAHDDGHKHQSSSHDHHDEGHSHGQNKGAFSKTKKVNGYDVNFQVVKAHNGGTHRFMIKLKKDGKSLSNVKVNSKVVHPNGKAETKMLRPKGDTFMASYNLGHEGRHQLMILFKTADGKKHSAGVYY